MTPKTLLTKLELDAEEMSFAAAHFTIFSATHRERLHGHNYRVHVSIYTQINDFGLAFDYAIYKEKLVAMCHALNSYLLLPQFSPHLIIHERDDHYEVIFDQDHMMYLKKDVKMLPVRNVTIEELSHYFANELMNPTDFKKYQIEKIIVKVSNGPGQNAEAIIT